MLVDEIIPSRTKLGTAALTRIRRQAASIPETGGEYATSDDSLAVGGRDRTPVARAPLHGTRYVLGRTDLYHGDSILIYLLTGKHTYATAIAIIRDDLSFHLLAAFAEFHSFGFYHLDSVEHAAIDAILAANAVLRLYGSLETALLPHLADWRLRHISGDVSHAAVPAALAARLYTCQVSVVRPQVDESVLFDLVGQFQRCLG